MTDTRSDELNLTPRRASATVWDRKGWDGSPVEVLVIPRLLIGAAGAVLTLQGLRQRTWMGKALASFGAGLAWWALTGEGELNDLRRWVSQAAERWRTDDPVEAASAESFPASDAPSWTPTTGGTVKRF
jgi:hypothetical protein